MTWKFDPSISSADYLALARKRARYCKYPKEMEWMLEWEGFDFGANREHVDQLLNPTSWSDPLVRASRKPRVFIDAYLNVKNNVEIRTVGGRYKIYFEDDLHRRFLSHALGRSHGSDRSLGEIMWGRDFYLISGMAVIRRNPVAKALLFGFKQRLDELIREISARLEVVGAMPMEFTYAGKNLASANFVPNITNEQIGALQREAFGWSFFDRRGDHVDLD